MYIDIYMYVCICTYIHYIYIYTYNGLSTETFRTIGTGALCSKIPKKKIWFAETKITKQVVYRNIQGKGHKCTVLHGGKTQGTN